MLTSGTFKITCAKTHLEKAELIGSSGNNAGTSNETFVFEECSVEGNGKGCEVEGGKITTNSLKNTLAFTNATSTQGEIILIYFTPSSGAVLGKVKFTDAERAICWPQAAWLAR